MTREGLYRNVPYSQIEMRLKQGWMFICEWSIYSVLMWHCECEIEDESIRFIYGRALK